MVIVRQDTGENGPLRRVPSPRAAQEPDPPIWSRCDPRITGRQLGVRASRLLTEQEMMATFGSAAPWCASVSALRSEGLVLPRRVVGAFVAVDAHKRPFRITLPTPNRFARAARDGASDRRGDRGRRPPADGARPSHLAKIEAAPSRRRDLARRGRGRGYFDFHRTIAAATAIRISRASWLSRPHTSFRAKRRIANSAATSRPPVCARCSASTACSTAIAKRHSDAARRDARRTSPTVIARYQSFVCAPPLRR